MTIYRCTASGVFASGLTWSFRQHFNSVATVSAISGDWAAAVVSAWTDATHGIEVIYPTGTLLTATSAAALSGVPFREGLKQVAPTSHAGTLATDSLPENNAILVSLRAAAVGGRNRGRIHLPAPAEDQAVGGELGTTPSTRVSTAMNALYASMRLSGHDPVIYNSRVSVADPVVQTTKSIVTEEVDRVLRSMRPRTRKRRAVYV